MTTETKAGFTAGPWHVGIKPGPMIYGPQGEQVADLTGRMVPDSETAGNSALIAAAPALFAALKLCRNVLNANGGFTAAERINATHEADKALSQAVPK